jgi:outer membrane protein
MKTRFQFLVLAAALAASGGALAQKAGSFSVQLGVTHLAPSVSSSNVTAPSLPNTQASVNSDTEVTGAVNYMLTDNVGLSVPIGYGFKHDVSGAGAIAGVGTLATTKVMPFTLIAQYRFLAPDARFRPYVGAGVTYAKFFDTNGTAVLSALTNPGGVATTVSFKSKWAPTLQLGLTYNLNEKWYLDASYTKTFVKMQGTLSTGQTLDMRLDPNTYTVAVGYRF